MKKLFCVMVSAVIFLIMMPVCVCGAEDVSAGSCILIEARTGEILFEKNAYEKRSMASTTKIMTTLLCLESGNLDDWFVVDSDAIKVEGSSMGLVEGDVVTKRMLCYGMLLPSGNDAANATAIKIGGSFERFAEMMNERAKEIGMKNTLFVTPSGLEGTGHGSTAYDMALLAREALRNSDFREICSQKTAEVEFGNPPYRRWLKNTNKLLSYCSGTIGVKTGFTDEAGRCLVSACERDGITLICVTLNDPNDWADHSKLYDYGFSILMETSLDTVFKNVAVNVAGGTEDTVTAGIKETITVGTKTASAEGITAKAVIPPFVYAPVVAGEEIGTVEYYTADGMYIDSVPVYAERSIGEKTIEIRQDNIFEKILKKFKK